MIEILRPDFPRGKFRAVLFDFDGTLSLIRRNWQGVMIPMMVEELVATGTGETREALSAHVEEYVMRLNGKQTIYQMMRLADEVRARGGFASEPLEYKKRYHDLLWAKISGRVEGLKSGSLAPDDLTVPGSRALLTRLKSLGLPLVLASGTDLSYVLDEAKSLALDGFFEGRIHGALDNYRDFSKAMIIEKIIAKWSLAPGELLAFGDGYVEIEETRKAGGVAVGVASEEETRVGVNAWKRDRLARAGADLIVGDYRELDVLLSALGLDGAAQADKAGGSGLKTEIR